MRVFSQTAPASIRNHRRGYPRPYSYQPRFAGTPRHQRGSITAFVYGTAGKRGRGVIPDGDGNRLIPDGSPVSERAGRNTRKSMYRKRRVFGIGHDADTC